MDYPYSDIGAVLARHRHKQRGDQHPSDPDPRGNRIVLRTYALLVREITVTNVSID